MKIIRKLRIILPVMFVMVVLAACSLGEKRYELTNYMENSVSAFERKSGIKVVKQGNGVFLKKDIVQVMAPEGRVTSVMLLNNADKYTIYHVGIGMSKNDALPLFRAALGNEISKTLHSEDHNVTYTFLNKNQELYVSFDADKNTVTQVSFYRLDTPVKEEKQENTQIKAGELIAMIGDTHVYYNEAMVYLKSAQQSYESEYGKDIWNADIFGQGNNFGKMIKDEVIKQITELKIIKAKAKELGISLDEEEIADAKAYANEHYEGLTTKDIKQYHITRELLQMVYEDNLLANKVFESETINVNTNVSDEEAKQITVQDILIYGVDFDEAGNKIDLSDEEKKSAYEKAKSLLKEAKKTKDFHALAEANSQADTIEYTFGKGQAPKEYGKEFEKAAFSLKTGEVSDLIKTDYGWHILYCVSDFNEDATTQVKEKIIEQRRTKMFADLYTKWSADYDVVVNTAAWNAVAY